MNKLERESESKAVGAGKVRLWWTGQAGFGFKTSKGRILHLDPYLSDSCERLHGLKRLSLPPVEPGEVKTDWVLFTHAHTDHLDPDTIPVIARNNPSCRFAGPPSCRKGLIAAGVSRSRFVPLHAGRRYDLKDVVIRTVAADHGGAAPDALAFLLEFPGGSRVMVSGDTAWRPERVQSLVKPRVDLVIAVINGVWGNMGPCDAAMMVQQFQPRYAVPCHFWTFAEPANGEPGGFLNACRQLSPTTKAMVLKPGEGFEIQARR